MILFIKTDISDFSWLQYILDEFERIESCQFSLKVIPPTEDKTKSDNCIHYLKEKELKENQFPCKEGILSDQVEFIAKDLFIMAGTSADNKNYVFAYDIFWNAFVFLSRLEEYRSEQNGNKIRSYSLRHPRKNRETFSIPVVNVMFAQFKQFIQKKFPKLVFGERQKPIIEYSHDIDYIKKTIQLRLKQTAFNGFKTLKSISAPKFLGSQFKKTISFFFSNPDYWPFKFWKEADQKYNVKSVFYIYAATGKQNFRSWLIDPSYDIRTNTNVQIALKDLLNSGFQIGLHGSFDSAFQEEQLKKEKQVLEDSIGAAILHTRQHWLNYEEMVTPYIHEKLFSFDSTLGWNDRIGFRSGVASRYRPFDHKNSKPFSYLVTPQVIMDSNLYDYGSGKEDELEMKSLSILESLASFNNSHVSVSWHDRVFTSDYNWYEFYEKIQRKLIEKTKR